MTLLILVVSGTQMLRPFRLSYQFPRPIQQLQGWVAPHQPRLDWQLWFAALGNARDTPPRFMRAVVCEYQFTDWPTKQAEDAWWQREPLGLYMPVLSQSKEIE